MIVNVLFFGVTKDMVGERKRTMEVPSDINVTAFKELLKEKYPEFNQLDSIRIAVNDSYAKNDLILSTNDEIALIPPVSGG